MLTDMVVLESLFTKYDRLNSAWRAAEEGIGHVPHNVEVRAWSECSICKDGEEATEFHILGVVKLNHEWRICHCAVYDGGMDLRAWKPIVDCSIRVRVLAAQYFKALVEAAEKARLDFGPNVEQAIAAIEAVTVDWNQYDPPEVPSRGR